MHACKSQSINWCALVAQWKLLCELVFANWPYYRAISSNEKSFGRNCIRHRFRYDVTRNKKWECYTVSQLDDDDNDDGRQTRKKQVFHKNGYMCDPKGKKHYINGKQHHKEANENSFFIIYLALSLTHTFNAHCTLYMHIIFLPFD